MKKVQIKKSGNPYNDGDVWSECFEGQSTPSNEPTSTNWDDHCVNVLHLLHDFQSQRSLASQDVRVVIPSQFRQE
jgi:hypothetical protein